MTKILTKFNELEIKELFVSYVLRKSTFTVS